MTISMARPRSAGERPSSCEECSSSTAKADSRSTRRRMLNAACRAGETSIGGPEKIQRRGEGCCAFTCRCKSTQAFAAGRTVAVDELAGAHRLLTLRLQLQQLQYGSPTARDIKLVAGSGEPAGIVLGPGRGRPHADELQVLSAKLRIRSRPGLESAQPVVDLLRGAVEIDQPIFFREDGRERSVGVVLRPGNDSLIPQRMQGLHEQIRAQPRQFWGQGD